MEASAPAAVFGDDMTDDRVRHEGHAAGHGCGGQRAGGAAVIRPRAAAARTSTPPTALPTPPVIAREHGGPAGGDGAAGRLSHGRGPGLLPPPPVPSRE